ncbi:MAG TPA: lysylphosphatidylglycerol synthase transmembrane domain-containing protein [Cyclobacteriaceae bacterium]|nr:lysylphosphatidylglycerol synthase transmembrane domain-containing protein [Cyclobacteriaceae bacterium]
MPKKLKTVLQYILMIAVTAGLLWLSVRGLKLDGTHEGQSTFDLIWGAWVKANKGYLMLMGAILILSHVLRSERWRMLLEPSGNKGTLSNSFLSVMVGYLVNLAIPRGGEVSRCYNQFKLENTPVEVSFGTVVVERIVDVLCLLVLIVISFVVEWDKLEVFIQDNFSGGLGTKPKVSPVLIIVLVGIAGLVLAIYLLRNNPRLKKLLSGFKEGLLAVFRLKNKWLFIVYSLSIWVLYFVMSYTVMLAFGETADLGVRAVLTIFAIGAIAMAVPTPGGAGSYHLLLPLGLVSLYHMDRADAVAFVFIFHAWQTLVTILVGVICLVISYWIIRWKKPQTK